MSRIAVLPPNVADQIAAGEVVERPYSVVKELVENSLDAGAKSIEITLEDGGKGLIRVSDDGSGMSADDAVLSLERHATSKIRSASDLVGVRSFGFRGEALPAISSVSTLTIETAPEDGAGVLVSCESGTPAIASMLTRRRGTTVTVASLFRNVPARQKFMRGTRSEWRAIQEAIIVLALTRLDVRFHLVHDGRQALSIASASSLRERVAQIWGAAFAESLLDVEDVWGPTHTSGLVERPGDVGTTARRAHTLVNGRVVRDNGLVRAAEAAYRNTIPAGMRPTLFLTLTVPGDSIDVNVHPAKTEIRFRDRWPVERSVERAVRLALGTFDSGAMFSNPRRFFSPVSGMASRDHLNVAPVSGAGFPNAAAPASAILATPSSAELTDGLRIGNAPEVDSTGQPDIVVPQLLQLRSTYMMFEREDGLVLIDQHSAHERVLFEKFMNAYENGVAAGQRLLFPLTLHLSPAESDAFEQNREALERLGFEIEGFGGNTLLVRTVPMPHPRFDAEHCLRDTIASMAGDRESSVLTRHERLVATVACKAAIKAGEHLTQPEMRALFVALAQTELPAHDVHGRAVVVHLTWDEVERRFGRR